MQTQTRLKLVATAIFLAGFAPTSVMASPYQQYKKGTCGTATKCDIVFPAIPASKTAELTNVSCYVGLSNGADIKRLELQQLLANNTVSAAATLPPSPYIVGLSTPNVATLGLANAQITLYASAGQKFRAHAEIVNGTFTEFSCHIAGKI